VAVIGLGSIPAGADELLGSEKLLAVVKKVISKGTDAQTADSVVAQLEQYSEDLKNYSQRRDTMGPKEAAAAWLGLLEHFFSFQDDPKIMVSMNERYPDYSSAALNVQSVFKAIPGPDSWVYFEELVQNRPVNKQRLARESGLRILVYFLNGKTEQLKRELNSLDSVVSAVNVYNPTYIKERMASLKLPILKIIENTSSLDVAANFEKAVDIVSKSGQRGGVIRIPDMVALKGVKKSAEIINRLLTMPGVVLMAEEGEETKALARHLALKNISWLNLPQWGLVNSVDAVALHEAIAQRFPIAPTVNNDLADAGISDYIQMNDAVYGLQDLIQRADSYYVLGLLSLDKTEQANKFVTDKGLGFRFDILTKFWQQTGRDDLAQPLFDLLHGMLEKDPALPAWEQYVLLAFQVKQTEKSGALMVASIFKLKEDWPHRLIIQKNLFYMDMALDKVEEAVILSREILGADTSQEALNVRVEFERHRFQTGMLLKKIGVQMDRPEWVQEGTGVMQSAIINFSGLSEESSYEADSMIQDFCEVLMGNHQFLEAEKLLMQSMIKKVQRNLLLESRNNFYSLQEPTAELTMLAKLYSQTGRPEDVIHLLTNAPWWGFKDVMDVGREDLVLALAKSLWSVGRNDEADKLVKAAVLLYPQSDDAYRLLIEHSDLSLIPWLDQVYKMDEFEERPLIWKAAILFKTNKLEEAERAVRQAIQIDPTDGEQRKGERIYSYTVLGDILAAQDKKDDAQFFHTVVRSVRLAEAGDELNDMGMISRSIKKYGEANAVFDDAYCIQWRLAERMYLMGNKEAALEHYRIAFERMPEQFGRVASFCFGCQGVFEKQQSRIIASEVLTRLKEMNPAKPQIYFLLGKLREAQGRYSDAYELYRQAVALDPDYFDAWNQMNSISDKVYASQSDKDAFILKLLKMDPLQKHFSGGLDQMSDLKSMWQVLISKKDLFASKPDALFDLAASRERIGKLVEKLGMQAGHDQLYNYWPVFNHPGNIVAEHVVSRAVQDLMQMDGEGAY
jgi:tetratricopeptide (TPR) repeat protein